MQSPKCLKNKNKIFIILTVLRRSVLRVVGSIYAAKRMGNTAPKKRRSGGEPLVTLSDMTGPGIEQRSPAPIAVPLTIGRS